MLTRLALAALIVLLLISGGSRTHTRLAFVNGQILTMDANNRVVEAILVENGRIIELGSTETIYGKLSASTQVIDLAGLAVMPGFIDAHSHFPSSGISAVSVNLSPPPIGDVSTRHEALTRLHNAAQGDNERDWLLGFNYDNTAFRDGRHPSRTELDAAVPDQPVYLWHSSGHMGVANSQALKLLGIDESSVPPVGGAYGKDLVTGRLNGLLQEKAAPPLAKIIQTFSLKKQVRIVTTARDDYLAAGVTTVQNGYAGKNMMRVLRLSQLTGVLPQRVVVWPALAKQHIEYRPDNSNKKQFNYRTGAVKIIVDGSPQGMTAYLSEPYFDTREKPAGYRGFPLIDQAILTKLVSDYHRQGYQLALHGNGDAAIDSIINAVTIAQSKFTRPDARHILVHAQTLRRDQILRLQGLSLSPSFFISHTYFWGDWHRQVTLGPARANTISPAQWTAQAGIRFSLHSDAPVTPISPMQILWSATQRQTQTGAQLGVDQRIDMTMALKAITIDAAWQNHIENAVGSLEIGKYADLVVLSQSPYDVEDVRDIDVLATYINGVIRYQLGSRLGGD